MQYNYFSKRSQMTAVLKQDIHRLRSVNPQRLSPKNKLPVFGTNQAGDAVLSGVKLDRLSSPISPLARHELAWKKD